MSSRTAVLLLALALSFSLARAHAEVKPDFAACDSQLATTPDAEQSAKCFYEVGRDPAQAQEAVNRLRTLLSQRPGHPWITFYLGHLTQNWAEAEVLYRTAARKFAERRIPRGEVLARLNLQRVLSQLGRTEAAGDEAEQAEKVADASGNPNLIAWAKIGRVRYLFSLGRDLERAYLLLRRAEEVAFPKGEYSIQRDCLVWLGNVSLELGRYEEAKANYLRAAELARSETDLFGEASARYSLARTFLDGVAEAPRPGYRQEAIELARHALATAAAAENRGVEAKAHWLLGLLTTGREARQHLEACLKAADNLHDRSYCLNALARHFSAEDPARARTAIEESLRLVRQSDKPWMMAYAWRERMRVSWASGSTEQAVADSESALDAIETLRGLQGNSSSQVGFFSSWSEDYSWLAGRLLEAAAQRKGRDSLGRAFGVMERKRARALLDALAAAQATPEHGATEQALRTRRALLLEDIARVQRRLLDPELPAAERTTAQTELEHLELEEAEVRDQIDRASPARSVASAFASLTEVQRALAPDEALLSFQVAPDEDLFGGFAGGSWLVVATRDGSRAYRLRRDRIALRPAVALFSGLFERRDGAEEAPAAGLYRDLLADALKDLPPNVRRLVLLPDDALHQLPFPALRPDPRGPPLASRYEITVAPSATLWLHWRRNQPAPAAEPLLALADPVMLGTPGITTGRPAGPPAERSAVFAAAARLEALPFARREGRAAARYLGGGSLLRMGEDASEGYLKSEDLRRFRMLHFATHAVLDARNPERSGILLTPAPATEDGLLQLREIVPLHLDGTVAVLSSCRSASGTVLRGEGVMGLARAFFQAGAHTVVASLWPLRDDDGAALFDRFYRRLAEGRSVAAALRAAQLDRIADGAPAYAWAGLVVLGDGNLVPLPGGRQGLLLDERWIAAGAILLLLAIASLLLWKRRRSVA